MKKNILVFCVAMLAIAGCSNNDCQDGQCTGMPDEMGQQAQALKPRNFGKLGGAPWGEPSAEFFSSTPAANGNFGQALALGYVNPGPQIDLVTSSRDANEHGTVDVFWSADPSQVVKLHLKPKDTTSADRYGQALAVGKFCSDVPTDVIVASAPYYDNYRGAIGVTFKSLGAVNNYNTKKLFINPTPLELTGMNLTVGDVDNDGKYDIVYQVTPIAPVNGTYEYQPQEIRVLFDFCNKSDLKDAVTVAKSDSGKTNLLGSALYVADLNKSGSSEIIAVDNLYKTTAGDGNPNGAIRFYKYSGGKFVESRPAIIGDQNDNSAASIESVAFADINGDGLLDLIVGEPNLNSGRKREGRVRTYTNKGTEFDTKEMLWSATAGRSNARFGSSVAVADLNNDTVPDLIVGAPGFRATDTINGQQGYVHVFMGTKDGSVFSTKPYWSHVSGVTTALNDDFGRKVVAVDLDGKGWLDLVVTAPDYSKPLEKQGRIDKFIQDAAPCYTADKCLIANEETGEEKCYDDNEVPSDSKCLVCNPSKDNFGLSDVVCELPAGDVCHTDAKCDPALGCQMTNAPDNTPCGESVCADDKTLTAPVCMSGICDSANTTSCDAGTICSVNMCVDGCIDDSDCTGIAICNNKVCETVGCLADTDCKPGEVCDLTQHQCVVDDKCSQDTDCAQGQICNQTTHLCEDKGNACVTDEDCTDDQICDEKTKTCISNRPPIIDVPAGWTVVAGNSIQLSVNVADPDNDPITIEWTGDDIQYLSDTAIDNPLLTIPASHPGGKLDLVFNAYDNRKAMSSAAISVEVIPAGSVAVDITAPKDGDVLRQHEVVFTGLSSGSGSVKVSDGNQYLCTAEIIESNWTCTATLEDGKYEVMAVLDTDPSIVSKTVSFSVETYQNPTISRPQMDEKVLAEDSEVTFEGTGLPGADMTLEAYLLDNDGNTVGESMVCAALAASDTTWNCSVVLAKGNYTATVSYTGDDGITYSSEKVYFSVIVPNNDKIAITSPTEGETIVNVMTVVGTAVPNAHVTVRDSDKDMVICAVDADDNGDWTCSSYNLKPGPYIIDAYLLENDEIISSLPVSIQYVQTPPAITSPADGAKVSVLPEFVGTVDQSDGSVSIWTVTGSVSTRLCVATVQKDGSWRCTTGFELDYDTDYSIVATWSDPDNILSIPSEEITIQTESVPPANVQLLNPTDGAEINNPEVIFSGLADPYINVIVHYYFAGETPNDAQICIARSNDNGRWACDDTFLHPGKYEAYAETQTDNPSKTDRITFTVLPSQPESEDAYQTTGGSCSLSTMPESRGSAWLLLIAGAGAITLIRRRKSVNG